MTLGCGLTVMHTLALGASFYVSFEPAARASEARPHVVGLPVNNSSSDFDPRQIIPRTSKVKRLQLTDDDPPSPPAPPSPPDPPPAPPAPQFYLR